MNGDHAIRELSYRIWEREGRPQGRDLEHWLMAEAELGADAKAARKPRRANAAGTARKRPAPREA